MHRKHLAALAALALAACGGPEQPSDTAEPTATAAPSASEFPVPSVTGEEVATQIPLAMQGRWGLVAGDCTSDKGDAKGLLVIGPETLRFYESVGTLAEPKGATEDRLRGIFSFTGEGMEWTREEVLELQHGSRVLVRRELGPDALPDPLSYMRCG